MALLFNSNRERETIYHNPISTGDLNDAGLKESMESVSLDNERNLYR
jgi:hypothetical protein